MKCFRLYNLSTILISLCLVSFLSCDKIEDATSVTVPIKDFNLDVSTPVGEEGSTGGEGTQKDWSKFSGEYALSTSDEIFKDYKQFFDRNTSVDADKVYITVYSEDGSGTKIKNFKLEIPGLSNCYLIPEYDLRVEHTSTELTDFIVNGFNKMIKDKSVIIKYSGETDVPAGKTINPSIRFEGVKVTGNMIKF